MEKGKLGLRMSFYTVCAFIFAFLGYSTLLFLLAGVVLLVEKDEWATRQMIQALCLCFVSTLVSHIVNVFDFIYNIPLIGTAWGTIVSVINAILALAILAFCVIGIMNTTKGKDANIPFAAKFADWAYGIIRENIIVNQPTQAYNTQPASIPTTASEAPVGEQAQPEQTTENQQ